MHIYTSIWIEYLLYIIYHFARKIRKTSKRKKLNTNTRSHTCWSNYILNIRSYVKSLGGALIHNNCVMELVLTKVKKYVLFFILLFVLFFSLSLSLHFFYPILMLSLLWTFPITCIISIIIITFNYSSKSNFSSSLKKKTLFYVIFKRCAFHRVHTNSRA